MVIKTICLTSILKPSMGMVFYQVFLLSRFQCTVTELLETVRGCVSLKKKKSQSKAVEVIVNSKEENSKTCVWISSKNFRPLYGGLLKRKAEPE
jgi:hypothetical protein